MLTRMRKLILGLALLSLGACTENLSTSRPYILTTATTGGTYYPVGVALATITKAQLHDTEGISLSAISSAGSLENIKLMRDNQAQFALLQGIFAAWAWNGEKKDSTRRCLYAAHCWCTVAVMTKRQKQIC